MQRKSKGRPSKLTKQMHDSIVQSIAEGNYIETAAALNDVTKKTVYEWLKLGRREETGKHRRFLNAVLKAQAEVEKRFLDYVEAGAFKDWRAAAWRLEHMRPRRYAQKQRIEHTGKRGGPIETREIRQMTDEELEAIARGEK